ncbi:hypothetical protein ACSBR1_040394 [Camellia fascicularis]
MLGITTTTALSPMGLMGMGMGMGFAPATATATAKLQSRFRVSGEEAFPSFLPREVHKIKDPFARNLATRIHRLPLQFWKSYIKRPMLLVGPSLGAAVAIDFAVNHSEAVEKLVLIDASVYSEGTSNMRKLPKAIAYAGVYLLKSIPLRLYATFLAFNGLPFGTCLDWTNVGRLHCLLPWWEDATVAFMNSGGYNVSSQIKQVKQKTLIIWGEDDQIISNKLAVKLHCELPNAIIRQVPDCGHIPHVEKPSVVAKLIAEFSSQDDC